MCKGGPPAIGWVATLFLNGYGCDRTFFNINDMEKVIAKVEREPGEKNFSCVLKVESVKVNVLGQGNTAKAAIADMLSGWEDAKIDLKEDGVNVPELDIEYTFDVGSLFNYYDFINVAGVSREIGISEAVMRQYAVGTRRPSQERKQQIVQGIKSLAKKIEVVSVY